MKYLAQLKVIVVVFACCLLAACSNSISLVKTEKNPAYPPQKYKKVLVVGISNNFAQRMLFEDILAHELQREGTHALQSYLVMYGPELSMELVVKAIHTSGADCVITTRLVGREEETKVVPGYETIGMTSTESDIDPNFYVYSPTVVMTPPTVITYTLTTVESRFFDAASARLQWSTKGQTTEVGKFEVLAKEYAKLTVKALKKEGLLSVQK